MWWWLVGGVGGFRSASHMSREITPRVAVVNVLNAAAGVWPVKPCPGEAYRGMRFGQGQHPAPDTRHSTHQGVPESIGEHILWHLRDVEGIVVDIQSTLCQQVSLESDLLVGRLRSAPVAAFEDRVCWNRQFPYSCD